jgi:hypothetical protein
VPANQETERSEQRFRGFSIETRTFLASLDPQPCPSDWPGGDRIAYAAHLLSPLKALASDLASSLAHVTPRLGIEPRIGRSLGWPDGFEPDSEECPVRQLRVWDGEGNAERSPILFVTFVASHMEIGLTGSGAEPSASARLRRALMDSPDGNLRGVAIALLTRGWRVQGDRLELPAGIVPNDIEPWMRDGIRVVKRIAWADWMDEPAFASEVAQEFESLLPLFDAMRDVRTPARTIPAPRVEPS